MAKLPRVNITIAPELKIWYETQAKSMGVTVSGLMVVALMQYKQQSEALNTMQGMPALMEELKKLQDKQIELDKQKK